MPETPTARLHSTGAGVQSTAISLLVAGGDLPKPDIAVFADTGWEPKQVYEQVDRLAALLAGIGVRFVKLSGGRQVDLLDVIAEEGDPDGCSPYGCRSGSAVTGGAA